MLLYPSFGSKNLKTIAVKGSQGLIVSDGSKFTQVVANHINKLSSQGYAAKELPELGTPFMVSVLHGKRLLPGDNFRRNILEQVDRINGEALSREILLRREGCFSCPIKCKRFTRVTRNGFSGKGLGPDFEVIAAFGAGCGIMDIAQVAHLNYICSDLGLDPVSMGSALSCFKELYEKGKVSNDDSGSFPRKEVRQASFAREIRRDN